MVKKLAKDIKTGDVVVTTGGHHCDVFHSERVTDRTTAPHKQVVKIYYLANGGGRCRHISAKVPGTGCRYRRMSKQDIITMIAGVTLTAILNGIMLLSPIPGSAPLTTTTDTDNVKVWT